jgi:hypothetical protein
MQGAGFRVQGSGFRVQDSSQYLVSIWQGVNHCRSHCRLAEFRGLMCRVKYRAVIGRKPHCFVCA